MSLKSPRNQWDNAVANMDEKHPINGCDKTLKISCKMSIASWYLSTKRFIIEIIRKTEYILSTAWCENILLSFDFANMFYTYCTSYTRCGED